MNEPIIISLSVPVQSMGEEIAELKLRRPKGKDYRVITSTAPMGMVLELAAAMAELPPSTIDQMDGEDIKKLVSVVSPFLS